MRIIIDGSEVSVFHRDVLFSFHKDDRLTDKERQVGVVLILMCEHWKKYTCRKIRWEKVEELAHASAEDVQAVFLRLVDLGWLRHFKTPDGAFDSCGICEDQLEGVARRRLAHLKGDAERQRAKAQGQGQGQGQGQVGQDPQPEASA